MKSINPSLSALLREKASNSHFTYKISAIALDKYGNILGHSTNSFSSWCDKEFYFKLLNNGKLRKGMGLHAERKLMQRYGSLIKTIIICRVGHNGNILPISPCTTCKKVANKLGIKIQSVME